MLIIYFQPRIFGSPAKSQEFLAHCGFDFGQSRGADEIGGFHWIFDDIVEFFGLVYQDPVGVAQAHLVDALFPHRSPRHRAEEVGGQQGLNLGSDMANKFVAATAQDPIGVVVDDFVEAVRKVGFVPAGDLRICKDRQQRAFGQVVGGWHIAPIVDGGADIGPVDQGLVVDAALRQIGGAQEKGAVVTALVEGCFGAGEGHGVVGSDDDQGFIGTPRGLECVE